MRIIICMIWKLLENKKVILFFIIFDIYLLNEIGIIKNNVCINRIYLINFDIESKFI